MRVFLSAIGSAGDVHPMVGLARRLQDRGHEVIVITSGYFEPMVRRAGLDVVPAGTAEEFCQVLNNPDLWHPTRGLGIVMREAALKSMRPIYDTIIERYRPGETALVGHGLDFGARCAQEKLNLPAVTVHLAPGVFRSVYKSPYLPPMLCGDWVPRWFKQLQWHIADKFVVDPLILEPLNAFRAELKLPPVRRPLKEWWHAPQCVVALFPDWFAPPQPDWPAQVKTAGFPLWDESEIHQPSGDIAEFLAAGAPPIVFMPGSAMTHAETFFRVAVDACERLGRRGVLLSKFSHQIPTALPPGVRHFEYVPFSWLLPRAAALVHHGGIGTLSQAVAAGVPQLIMPMAHDQPDNALRAQRLGIAAVLPPRRFKASAVTRTLRVLLNSPHVNAHCRQQAERLVLEDGLGRAWDLIEESWSNQPKAAA